VTSTEAVRSAAVMSDTAAHELDGRLARSARTRRAIVDALRSLHHEGDLRPTAPRVAERAGVSLRTVWQHFNDLEALLVAAGQRGYEIAMRYVTPIDVSAPLPSRLRQLVAQRGRMYEELAPVWRAARLQEPFSPAIRRNRERLLEAARDQLDRVVGPELADLPTDKRGSVFAALQVATTWSTWESLRGELSFAVEEAEQAVLVLVSNLLQTL
jgi:TetR/AcrR family transcriptional regulator, regulator of autoinduction and epiphytic fitness